MTTKSARKYDGDIPLPPRLSHHHDVEYRPEDSIGYQLRKSSRTMAALLNAQLSKEKITIGMWYFLRVLWERDGVIQRELTDQVGFMQPTTVAALRGMQRRGLIRMEPDQTDRRKIRIFLTKEGRRLKSRLLPRVAHINDIVLSGITPQEHAHFLQTLTKIQKNAAAEISKE